MGDDCPANSDGHRPDGEEEECSKKSFTPIVKVNTFIIFLEKNSTM